MRGCHFTVVPVSPWACPRISLEVFRYHFTPPKDYRNGSKMTLGRVVADARKTHR